MTYTPNIAGTGRLMRGPEMQRLMREIAEKGMEYARGISPVGDPRTDPHPGEYRDSFSVTVRANGGVHNDRAEAMIVNSSPHAVLVEALDGYHVLARMLDAMQSGAL
ncbi:MAG TPA: HK97 gp10 family phage protein [Frankiaceae bacterium]|nr:HK97 gp10 family phage protein [Frankiaceae bacterium]